MQSVPYRTKIRISERNAKFIWRLPSGSIFDKVRDTNKSREKSKLACIFSETQYLRHSQSWNKRAQCPIYLAIAERISCGSAAIGLASFRRTGLCGGAPLRASAKIIIYEMRSVVLKTGAEPPGKTYVTQLRREEFNRSAPQSNKAAGNRPPLPDSGAIETGSLSTTGVPVPAGATRA